MLLCLAKCSRGRHIQRHKPWTQLFRNFPVKRVQELANSSHPPHGIKVDGLQMELSAHEPTLALKKRSLHTPLKQSGDNSTLSNNTLLIVAMLPHRNTFMFPKQKVKPAIAIAAFQHLPLSYDITIM